MRFATAMRTSSAFSCAACSRSTSTPSRCSPWPRGGSFRPLTRSMRATWWIIGRAIADSLFPSLDPLGKSVRLDGRLYEVVGVFEPDQGLFSSFGVDQFACIPMSNFRKTFPEIKERFIAVAGKDGFSLDTVKGPGGGSHAAQAPRAVQCGGRFRHHFARLPQLACGISLPAPWFC